MDKERLSVVGAIALNGIFGDEPQIARSIIGALGSAHALSNFPRRKSPHCSAPEADTAAG